MTDANTILRVGLIQMLCEKGDLAENLRETERHILAAEQRGVDIIAFPEMSVTGYANPQKYPQAIIRLDGPEIADILKMSVGREVILLVGLIEENPAGKPFVTQAVIHHGQIIGYYRKNTIKDAEAHWFSPGDKTLVFTHNNLRMGTAICADIDNEGLFAEYARQGTQIVFELAAPGLYGSQAARDWQAGFAWWAGKCRQQLSHYAQKYRLWIVVATQAGRTVDEDFPGGGYVFAPDGRRLYATPDWSTRAVYLTLDLDRSIVTEE
jgi:predicted amidohydrolase